jgi:hypothetical protein
MARYTTEPLQRLLRRKKTATLAELKKALGTDVDMTVFRKLAKLSYRTSYSHGGRYYTLDEIAHFDDLGLWSHRCVWFSRYGTLLATLEALVNTAKAGYFAHELQECLHVDVKASLLRLVNDERIVREKMSGLYLYSSADARVGTQQRRLRREQGGGGQRGAEADRAEPSEEVKAAIVLFFSLLNEQQRRLFAGLEALQFAEGDRWVAELLGVHIQTVAKGRRELVSQEILAGRSRRPGGGRKRTEKKRRRSSRTSKR